MVAFERACAWCDSLPRDRMGLPPCYTCPLHEACTRTTMPMTYDSLAQDKAHVGSEFVRLVE